MGDHLASIELWGGVECTINRVGQRYFDQFAASGHAARASDLDRFHALGFRTLRYPVSWERVCAAGEPCFEWVDRRLARFQELAMTPIVGLLHHGSGPRGTSLVDPEFPEKFSVFAASVAERYPWVEAYTPVNEPLTTARFSCLYGHWFPHERNDRAFVRALLNQCKATVLAMREIRLRNPAARLVQTEDLGHTRATRGLEYQAEFENERRFLSFDLLMGRVGKEHALHEYLVDRGATLRELEWFQEHATAPDSIGVNYYITSERFLDLRTELYPETVVGGNGRHRYADVEAVRVAAGGLLGPEELITSVWDRYRVPVAVTEAHLGCTADERIRWIDYVLRAAKRAKRRGVDLSAVCIWALLGSFGWNRLLTGGLDSYEEGVFSVRGGRISETDVTDFVAGLLRGGKPDHPALCRPGWWLRDDRFVHPRYPAVTAAA
ncbi:MAG TPA: family 1 glycosylhydrolase [Polyangiaceae bacterium]|nr:family 1 glycosylhydrolase [Polyangiaceae bacterium]